MVAVAVGSESAVAVADLDIGDLRASPDQLGPGGATSRTTSCRPCIEPGGDVRAVPAGVTVPTTIEQPDPGGVSWTSRTPSPSTVS